MEFLKKIFILLISLALISGVVYLIFLSQMAQDQRENLSQPEEQELIQPPPSGFRSEAKCWLREAAP